MSHSNTTPNYSLPQFINTDKPAWLTDINGAFTSIDTAVKNAADAASTADGKAVSAQDSATLNTEAINTLSATVTSVTTEHTTEITLDPAVATGTLVIHTYGKIVQIEADISPVNYSTYVNIYTLNDHLKPNETLYVPGVGFGGATGTPHMRIRANGMVEVYVPTGGNVTVTAIYIIRS